MTQLSTDQVAQMLNERFDRTTIDKRIAKALVDTHALTDVGPGRSIRVELTELETFIARTRPVTRDQWPEKWPLYRMSLLALREDEAYDQDGVLVRTHAGAHYGDDHGLPDLMWERAWTGLWPVSEENAEEAVEAGAIGFGTTKGYIHPTYVRQIVGHHRHEESGRVWWDTAPAPAEVMDFVGTGLWMSVEPGAESNWA